MTLTGLASLHSGSGNCHQPNQACQGVKEFEMDFLGLQDLGGET